MVSLAPSLLSSDFSRFGETLAAFDSARGSERPELLHFDIMDGHFVPNLTFGTGLLRALRGFSDIPFDVHLMVENAERYISACRDGGAQRVAVHLESVLHLPRVLSQIRNSGMLAGVALNPATPIESLRWVVDSMDYLIIMGVNPGFSGQSFIPTTIEKLRNARAMLDSRCSIVIDGGVSSDNAAELCSAGAEVLVAGSSLFSALEQNGDQQGNPKGNEESSAREYRQLLSRLSSLRKAAIGEAKE